MKFIGKLIWILAWPFWVIYFRVVPNRSRVLVIHEKKLLLLKDYIGDDVWGLPGGGAHNNEPLEESAVRELKEEVGLDAEPSQLEALGGYEHKKTGFTYTAHYFLLRLSESPELKKRWFEIRDIGWFDKNDLKKIPMNQDAKEAVKRYTSGLI